MAGTRITDQQVCLYMNLRKNKSQVLAVAKPGVSERTARQTWHMSRVIGTTVSDMGSATLHCMVAAGIRKSQRNERFLRRQAHVVLFAGVASAG